MNEPEPMVTAIRVQCPACRRARAAGLRHVKWGERPTRGLCPHYRTVWAPGYGPGSPRRPWRTSPPPV
jgi:hypothetical protein